MSVTVYALSTCPYCKMTKDFLTDRGVEYEVLDVDLLEGDERQHVLTEVQRISGGTSFPVVVYGDSHVVGYDQAKIKELLDLA
jgi:glutaredoxin-like protein NrdH